MKQSKLKQAVILAGGQGIRLRPLTNKIPKPMIRFYGKPFLEYLIELLKKNGIKEILILTGYLHEKIEHYFQDGKKWGVKINYSFSPTDVDTGLRIKNAATMINSEFLLLYADNYWPLDLKKHVKFYRQRKILGLVTVYNNLDDYTKNNMLVNKDGFVEIYDKTRKSPNLNGVDIGFFIFNKKVLDLLPKTNSHFELEVLPKLIAKKQLVGYVTYHKYYGLSNSERMPIIEKYLKPKQVVFLDRDGVINKKPPKAQYVTSWQEFSWLPHAKDALKLLTTNSYQIFIVSNQAGIARGIVSQEKVDEINEKMKIELKEIGVDINGVYICPHGWYEDCFCRKPKPGLFFKAAAEHCLELHDAYCIGDDERDIMAGKVAGCQTFLVHATQSLYNIVRNNLK